MTDNPNNGNPKSRLILAPYPWPVSPGSLPKPYACEQHGPFFYLSWAGWELYLTRRLGFGPASPDGPKPLLLPDMLGPEEDFLALDQLAVKASQLGSGLLNLGAGPDDGLFALISGIRDYSGRKTEAGENPILDDRSYLALWAASELRALESDQAMAEAQARQKAMWAALKGEDEADGGQQNEPLWPLRPAESSARAAYAWQCWHRLAKPFLRDSDQIVAVIDFPAD